MHHTPTVACFCTIMSTTNPSVLASIGNSPHPYHCLESIELTDDSDDALTEPEIDSRNAKPIPEPADEIMEDPVVSKKHPGRPHKGM